MPRLRSIVCILLLQSASCHGDVVLPASIDARGRRRRASWQQLQPRTTTSTRISILKQRSNDNTNDVLLSAFTLPRTSSSTVFSIEQLRGGGAVSTSNFKSTQQLTASSQPKNKTITTVATTLLLSLTVVLSILNWETLVLSLSTFVDKEKFRKSILDTLTSISSRGTQGLILYTIGFTFWEVCGLPTSVVETAAGMAFGYKRGLITSFVGKTSGSILAFVLGRTLLRQVVQSQMEENETLELIDKSVARNPVKSALIVRYSVFPQLIKNYGLSMTQQVSLPIFIMAIFVHGMPFSILWAALGNDSSLRLRAGERGEVMDANVALNSALVFVTFLGFVISPIVTGWWLNDLRKEKSD
eukprot:scaffold427_cov103-Alexandrium_tamarense.AAC.41